MTAPTLKRSLGLPLLTLYGLGTILGAGIYVLIGEVAGSAGTAAPSAFLLASILAGLSAFSYAELASRLPKSAGEAAYMAAGFSRPTLTAAVGWCVVSIGVVSAATMSRGFVGYLAVFTDWPSHLVLVLIVGALGAVAAWGISQSAAMAAAVTLIEVGGLVLVCLAARNAITLIPARWPELLPQAETASLLGVVSGAIVAFYAFVGFEDMVNVAEEVKKPRTTLPHAIVIALATSTLLYFVVATIAVLSLPPERLAASEAPLAVIMESQGLAPEIIAAISLLAVLNGALVQIIMAARVLYGLAGENLAPRAFARIDPRTRTPLIGTAVLTLAIMLFALLFSLGELARLTSLLTLAIFALANAALWRLKRSTTATPAFEVPLGVPIAGTVLCGGMVCYQAAVFFALTIS